MRLAKIVGVSFSMAVLSSITLLNAVRADTGAAVHSRPLSAIEHDYGQDGADAYWESQAAQGGVKAAAEAPADAVSAVAEPPVQNSHGWYGRAGGYAGSDRVEKLGAQGQSAVGASRLFTAQPEDRYGRTGAALLPAPSN